MKDVMQAIYQRLSSDAALGTKLAEAAPGVPAIYAEWGERKQSPYIVLTYLPSSAPADLQVEGTLQVDIFDRRDEPGGSYLRCLEIRDDVVRLLDRFKAGAGDLNLRVYYNGENPTAPDGGRYRRHLVEFQYRSNRTADLQT